VRTARRHGLKPYVYFIHGLPGQTPESSRRTARLIHEMGPEVEKITVYRFKPLPGSAFEDEPPGTPSWMDQSSRTISEAAREVNLGKKNAFVGRVIKVIAAEGNFQRKGEVICFPLRSGPIVTVPGPRRLIGKELRVRITRAISERLLSGELLELSNP
jgi:tRNA A37 methylthiotransferase MiaB